MRIAVSGTHFIGKSTLIEDFIKLHPDYKTETEPYYQLLDEGIMELALEPTLESLIQQLDYSIEQLNKHSTEKNIIFDRCPVDFIAYAMCIAEQDEMDIEDNEIAEKFADVKQALNNIDLIIFLPISKENSIKYSEENPEYRKLADKCFKKIYRDEACDIFPGFNHPRIVEVTGEREARVKILESYLIK
ncbi:MAG TPA: AAA family ATPase [Gammaproteobacteria bacterium]|nr:AAA family ATPase [Gammaproteobacteria bacterium]